MATVKTVQIVVEAQDKASKTLMGIGRTLSTAVGTFVGGAALKAASAGFDALTGAIGDCIQESRDAAKGLAQTQAVIKSTGGKAKVTAKEIVDLSGALSHTTLFTDDAIQAQQNLLLTFTNVRNEAGKGNDIFTQTSKIGLDMAQSLGTDAAGAAIQLGKALGDPVKGITALTRVGVTFTAQQKEQIKTLVASGDVMSAQKIILAELNAEFGGSAEAAAKADGGWHLFNQRLSDVKQTIGDALMPVLNDLMTWLSGPGLDAVEKFGTGVATWLTDTAIPNLKAAVKTVQDTINAFKSGDFSSVRIDLEQWLSFDTASKIAVALQDMRKGWGLLRDSVVTFKEAWEGDWKDAPQILPLHQAIGEFAKDARAAFDDLTYNVLPAFKKEWEDAMPVNTQLLKDFGQALDWLDKTIFPPAKDALNAQEKATRDYGIEVGATTAVAKKTWLSYWFDHDNIIQHMMDKQNELMLQVHDIYTIMIPAAYAVARDALKDMWGDFQKKLLDIEGWINRAVAALLRLLGLGSKPYAGAIIGSGTPGGQSVIGAQVAGISARGIPLTLPSGFAAPPSSSIAPRRGARDAPSVTVDLHGSSFGAGLTEPQVRDWIGPVVEDALTRWENGIRRQIGDLDTRGALR